MLIQDGGGIGDGFQAFERIVSAETQQDFVFLLFGRIAQRHPQQKTV